MAAVEGRGGVVRVAHVVVAVVGALEEVLLLLLLLLVEHELLVSWDGRLELEAAAALLLPEWVSFYFRSCFMKA